MLRLTHFTPTSRAHWCWCFTRPVLTLLPGPQKLITGGTVMHGGSTVWEGIPGMPKFDSREEGLGWCEINSVMPDLVDLGESPLQ